MTWFLAECYDYVTTASELRNCSDLDDQLESMLERHRRHCIDVSSHWF